MILFICIFCIVLYFLYYRSDTQKNRNQYINIITIVLIIFSGLRHEAVGSDTINYLKSFDEAIKENWSDVFKNFYEKLINPSKDIGKDPALYIYNKLMGIFVNNHAIYLLVSASLLLVPLAAFLKSTAKSLESVLFGYLMFISIYYVYMPNSALRQSIALGFLLLGYLSLLKDNRPFRFLIYIVLAMTFHKSALIGLLFLIPRYFKNSPSIYKLGVLFFFIMLFEYRIVGITLTSQSEIYSMYSGVFYESGVEKPFVILLFFAGLYFMGLLQLKHYVIAYKKEPIANYAISGTVYTLVFSPLILLDPSLIRITAYFIIWMMIFIPDIIQLYSKSYARMLFIACVLMFLYKAYKSGGDYAFFWQYMKYVE